MDDDLGFFVDTSAADDNEEAQTFSSPFPVFGSSKFSLSAERNEDSDADSDNDEEYFGEF